jgi:ABC-type amino acid transport substrate-binding protein
VAACVVAALALATAAGCGDDSDSESTASAQEASGKLAEVKEAGTITIGTSGVYPPFEFVGDGGELEGFDIDLCNAIAKKLGVEAKWEKVAFEGIIAALKSDRVDMLCTAMTNTPDRAKEIAFSDPYYKTRMAITTRADNNDITGRDDLVGKKLGAEQGSRGAFEAQSIKDADVKIYTSIDLAFKDLDNGRIDAVTEMLPATAYVVERNYPDLKVAADYEYAEGGEVGLNTRLEDEDLLEAVNTALGELQSEGLLDELQEKWFGSA